MGQQLLMDGSNINSLRHPAAGRRCCELLMRPALLPAACAAACCLRLPAAGCLPALLPAAASVQEQLLTHLMSYELVFRISNFKFVALLFQMRYSY